MTLMFSARSADELYDRGLMRYWALVFPKFRYLPTITREKVRRASRTVESRRYCHRISPI